MKKILNILFLLLFIFSLASCNTTNDNNDNNNNNNNNNNNQTTSELDELYSALNELKIKNHSAVQTATQKLNIESEVVEEGATFSYQKNADKAYLTVTSGDQITDYYFEMLEDRSYEYTKTDNTWKYSGDFGLYDYAIDLNDIGFEYNETTIVKEENKYIGNNDAISAQLRRIFADENGIPIQNISVKVNEFYITIDNNLITNFRLDCIIDITMSNINIITTEVMEGSFSYDNIIIEKPNNLESVFGISCIQNALDNLYEIGFYATETISYEYNLSSPSNNLVSEDSITTNIWVTDNKQQEESFKTPSWELNFYTEAIIYGDIIKAYSTTDYYENYKSIDYKETRAYHRQNLYIKEELKDNYFITTGNYCMGITDVLNKVLKESVVNQIKAHGVNATMENTSFQISAFEVFINSDTNTISNINYIYNVEIKESSNTHTLKVRTQFVVMNVGKQDIAWPSIFD